MAGTLTITGTAGPAKTVTAGVFTGLAYVNIDMVNNIVSFDSDGQKQISVAAAATVTATKSGSTWTLTIS